VQVECGILKWFPVKFARTQAGLQLNIFLKSTSVKDGLALVELGENAGIPSLPALRLHFVGNWCLFLYQIVVLLHFIVQDKYIKFYTSD
jgi:hypothetical protein